MMLLKWFRVVRPLKSWIVLLKKDLSGGALEKLGFRVKASRCDANGGKGGNNAGLGGGAEVKLSLGNLVLLLGKRRDVRHLVSVGFIVSGLHSLLVETVRVSLIAERARVRIGLAGITLNHGHRGGLDSIVNIFLKKITIRITIHENI